MRIKALGILYQNLHQSYRNSSLTDTARIPAAGFQLPGTSGNGCIITIPYIQGGPLSLQDKVACIADYCPVYVRKGPLWSEKVQGRLANQLSAEVSCGNKGCTVLYVTEFEKGTLWSRKKVNE